ncbi:MAG: hypothetical protein WCK90_03560 [archaeon]
MTYMPTDNRERRETLEMLKRDGNHETMPHLTVEDLRRMAYPDLTGDYNAAVKYVPMEVRRELDENLDARSL